MTATVKCLGGGQIKRKYTGGFSYRQKFSRLGLFSLKHQRLHDDLIEEYKMMTGLDRIDSQNFFLQEKINTRGQSFKVGRAKFKGDAWSKFLFYTMYMVRTAEADMT